VGQGLVARRFKARVLFEDLFVADPQALELAGFRVSPGGGLQAFQQNIPYPGARQPESLVSDSLEHPADLALLAFMDHQDYLGIVTIGDGLEYFRRGGLMILDSHTSGELVEGVLRGFAVNKGDILFLDLVAGMGDAVVQFADVGHQQEPLGIPIEPADRQDPAIEQGGWQVVHYRETFMGVMGAGDDARWLVKEDGPRLRQAQHLVVHGDDIAELDHATHAYKALAVYQYPAGLDEELGSSTGGVSASRDVFMESHDDGLYLIIPPASRPLSGLAWKVRSWPLLSV